MAEAVKDAVEEARAQQAEKRCVVGPCRHLWADGRCHRTAPAVDAGGGAVWPTIVPGDPTHGCSDHSPVEVRP